MSSRTNGRTLFASLGGMGDRTVPPERFVGRLPQLPAGDDVREGHQSAHQHQDQDNTTKKRPSGHAQHPGTTACLAEVLPGGCRSRVTEGTECERPRRGDCGCVRPQRGSETIRPRRRGVIVIIVVVIRRRRSPVTGRRHSIVIGLGRRRTEPIRWRWGAIEIRARRRQAPLIVGLGARAGGREDQQGGAGKEYAHGVSIELPVGHGFP